MRSLRLFLLMAVLAAPAFLLVRASTAQRNAPVAKPQTARQRFKNIRVLKDLPADRLLPTMRTFSASLGVRCDFCHVLGPGFTGFEKDDRPTKRVARQMILMVRDINHREKALGGLATCYMCHHGDPEPQTRAPERVPGRRPEGRDDR
jgi:hypothetical protein